MVLKVGSIEVLHKPAAFIDAPISNYAGLKEETQVLRKGHQRSSKTRPFPVNTIYERDIEIPLRDGVKLRADVFRPEGNEKVPALLPWSPYGKSGTGFFHLDIVPQRVGVQKDRLSGYEKFEGPDPAEWVPLGYAVVNVDSRGAFDSEGDIRYFGAAEGRDGYDTIEEIAKMPWCNGKVAMVGNSWLAVSQWWIAAEKPPHLACMAPLEGASDLYREMLCRGGIPQTAFMVFIASMLFGRNQQEDLLGMLAKYPTMNEYWTDKRVDFSKIDVPAYVLGSYSTGIHTAGAFRAFEEINHDDKWLRVHPTQEWHDLYSQDTIKDLKRFFDYYTKGSDNGWPTTPKVRLSMLRYNNDPIVNHPFATWPITNTKYSTFYLDGSGHLSGQQPSKEATLTYKADAPCQQVDADPEELRFSHVFKSKSYLVGYTKATLYMSCPSHSDLDVFLQLRKADKDGNILKNFNIPLADWGVESTDEITLINTNAYLGPTGMLRASHRAIDSSLAPDYRPIHDHTEQSLQPLTASEIVRLEFALWPTGMAFEAGEQLVLKVAGHPMTLAEFEPLRGSFQNENKGEHVLYMGGKYDSNISVPFVEL